MSSVLLDHDALNKAPEDATKDKSGFTQGQRSIEIQMAAGDNFDFNMSPILPNRVAPDEILVDEIMRESITPMARDVLSPERTSIYTSPHINEELPSANLDILDVQRSPDQPIMPPTPIFNQRVTRRKRKRQPFDEAIVLSNKFIRDMQNDPRDIIRDKGDCPTSSLAIWKRNKKLQLKKNGLLANSYTDGACADLHGLYSMSDVIPERFHLITEEENVHQDVNTAQPPTPGTDNTIEIEHMRSEFPVERNGLPSFSTVLPLTDVNDFFPGENSNTVPQKAQDPLAEMEIPDTSFQQGILEEQFDLPEVPEAEPFAEELGFLDLDNNTPTGSPRTPRIRALSSSKGTPQLLELSSRTRAVAQFLRDRSSTTPSPSDELSLNEILKGKPRKICARMFYETLVLKTHELIHVHQETPYDDVTLRLAPQIME